MSMTETSAEGADGQSPSVGSGAAGLASMVRECDLPSFMLSLPGGVIGAVSPLLVALLDRAAGDLVGRPIWAVMSEGPTGILDLLAAGSVDGVELKRTFLRSDGTTVPARVLMTAFVHDGNRGIAVGIVSSVESMSRLAVVPIAGLTQRPLVIGTVDEQWRVDRISCDVDRLLGHSAEAGLGRSILSLVHPEDVPALLTNLAAMVEQSSGVTLSLRLVLPDGGWRACDVLVTPLPQVPRFAFVLTSAEESRATDRGDVEEALWDLWLDAQATETSRRSARLPVQGTVPGLGKLSARELQVTTRLLDGKRVPAIASELFLAQGTVRNHLSSVFRKLRVASQQELVDLLRSR
jgi:DNA-binding CsgD family transcriptional regulator